MNKLHKIKGKFVAGDIDKWQYINEMYDVHSCLFDYAEFITETNINSIEIVDKQVIMKFRDSDIRFICKENDKRLAPLETLNFKEYETPMICQSANTDENSVTLCLVFKQTQSIWERATLSLSR